jgi:hypothetical protein
VFLHPNEVDEEAATSMLSYHTTSIQNEHESNYGNSVEQRSKWSLRRHPRNFPPFLQRQGSLPCPQDLACPVPNEPTPNPDPDLMISNITVIKFQNRGAISF